MIARYAWGDVWQRGPYDERTRRAPVIGVLFALDKWDEFRRHVRAALVDGDFSAVGSKEIMAKSRPARNLSAKFFNVKFSS